MSLWECRKMTTKGKRDRVIMWTKKMFLKVNKGKVPEARQLKVGKKARNAEKDKKIAWKEDCEGDRRLRKMKVSEWGREIKKLVIFNNQSLIILLLYIYFHTQYWYANEFVWNF